MEIENPKRSVMDDWSHSFLRQQRQQAHNFFRASKRSGTLSNEERYRDYLREILRNNPQYTHTWAYIPMVTET